MVHFAVCIWTAGGPLCCLYLDIRWSTLLFVCTKTRSTLLFVFGDQVVHFAVFMRRLGGPVGCMETKGGLFCCLYGELKWTTLPFV